MPRTVDAIVIGMGPGGEAIAGRLAKAGLETIGVESHLVGGECPYYGCIPSKMIIRGAEVLAEGRRIPELAGASTVNPDYTEVSDRIRDEATTNWDDTIAVDRFTAAGGVLVRGHGRLVGPDTVEVDGEQFIARRAIVLNTGTSPAVPPIDGLKDTPFWTNREILKAREAPRSLAVIGGGAIGLELAQGFSRFGTEVTIIETSSRVLAVEEPEAGDLLADVLGKQGLTVLTNASVTGVSHSDNGFRVTMGNGELAADELLVATGRRTNLSDIGLDAIDVDPASRFLEVDEHMVVSGKVYAIGDITGKGGFTHISMYQHDVAARHILDEGGVGAEYHAVPRVTFTDPEIGAVGISEKQARDKGLSVRTSFSPVSASTRGWIHGPGNDGFYKLVADADRGVLVGATSAGPNGGEVLAVLTLAVHAAIPIQRLREMIYAYPTIHRGIEPALAELV